MKILAFIFLFVLGSIAASAQILTAAERKEMEAELKDLKEQLKNADPDERKQLEAMGLPAMIKFMEQQLLSGTSGDKKKAKEVNAISEAEKDKIYSRVSASSLPDSLVNPGQDLSFRVRSSNDLRVIDAAKEYASFLTENAGFIGRVAPKPVSFAQAISKAKTLCSGKIPAAEFGKLKAKAPQGTKAADFWQGLAAMQGMAGSPEAAFCLLVTAYEADPNNPDVLTNLAGAMAMLGLANESLAVLDEIAKRNLKPSPPMGISAGDMLDYIRSYSQLLTGNTGNVRSKLESIAGRQPLLAEAKMLLSLLDEKEGKDGKPRFMMAQSRSPQAKYCVMYPGEVPEPGEQTYNIDPRSILDPSKGIRGKLPAIKYPQNPEEATARLQSFSEEEPQRILAELMALNEMRTENHPNLKQWEGDNTMQDSWGYSVSEFIASIDWRDAKLRELKDKIREAEQAEKETGTRIQETLNKAWPPIALITPESAKKKAIKDLKMRLMGMCKSDIEAVDKAIRDYYEEWSYVATMLAATVDDAWHREFELVIQLQQWGWYQQLVLRAAGQSGTGWIEEGGYEDASETLEPATPEECNDGGMKQKVGIETVEKSFGASIGLDCEGVTFEVTAGKMSAELGLDKKGGYTIFGGPKAGVKVGGAGVEVKAGGYISGKIQGGTIEKVGVKVEGNVSAGSAPIRWNLQPHSMTAPYRLRPGFKKENCLKKHKRKSL
ncbi:MAG: hypothetical protein KIT80_12745 [Chitinophagaceae bacterium]|nr:hypothetical protein [Chitinophagaceae bacterium]MCW5927773.1 hypothetical protein [Chitinophagaceae bacterium]